MTSPAAPGHDRDIAQVEYRVLGPLTAISDGTRISLGGKRQQMVLAVLLGNSNRVISQDALIDAVWNGSMPESGPRSLHTYVSLLRKALGGGIERQGDGYVLGVGADQVDAIRFESLVAEARPKTETYPEEAAQLLRNALGLWTGTAYGELGYEPALRIQAARLATERVSALELRFEVDLMLGRHEPIIPEIEALLGEEPYREHLTWMLMLALYRSGRQAEALRQYWSLRERLIEELGIDPGQELQDLELRILDRDPSLQPPSPGTGTAVRDEVHGARGYEVHEPIGRTDFGERFRGFHGTMAREVSVLVIDDTLANAQPFVRNFESEMQAVSHLEHPHLAPVLDYWRDPQQAYVITPFYRGGTLESALANSSLTLVGALRLADQLSAGLGSLHRHGQCHGAISAASVLLDEEQNAYLADTGLVRALGQTTSFEVADDIAQLGALVFEALTLRRPEDGTTVDEMRGDLPSELGHAISRALHADPALRYQRVEDFARAMRQSAGLDVMVVPEGVTSDVERRNPYKGLRAFQESDASDFHGRDALVEEMVEALTASWLMAVVGPSGSGKSSAVRAGLLPKLRNGAVPGSDDWLITDMFPGTHPFETLAAALLRVATIRPPGLYETLTADRRGLAMIVDRLLQPDGSGLLIAIDQFEELFSLVPSIADRQRFLDTLVAAGEESRLRIVLTMRADFFDQPLQYPEFAEIFRSNVVAMSPPTRDGLARAITQPALSAGVSLEPGLVTRIVDDVREQPGGLPLLQFALTDLFARRDGDILALDAYNASGGVGGALAQRAEETYSSLTPQGKDAARQLFLRLVTVDELADDTRRRVQQSELLGLDLDRQVMSHVMQQFGALRFLSFDRDPASRAPTVELAHEALLREWQRLKTWIDEQREDLLIHRRIQITVHDWRESGGDPSYLLRGGRLEQTLLWMDRTDIAISTEETAFIEASFETEKIELAERQALEGKAARRRKAVIGVLAGGLVVAGGLGAVAVERAQEARIIAANATARDLSAAALGAIDEDPELGVLLSLEAVAATDSMELEPVPEAASALRTTLAQMRIEARLPTGFEAVAYSGDGTRLVTDDVDDASMLHLRDAASTRPMAQWTAFDKQGFPPAAVTQVRFSPDDSSLAATWASAGHVQTRMVDVDLSEAESMIALTLHNPKTLNHRQSLSGEPGRYRAPSFGANDLIAASFIGATDTGAYVWNRETGETVARFASGTTLGGEFIPDTTILVLAHGESRDNTGEVVPGRLQAIDVTTSEEVWAFPLDVDPGSIVLSPDGSTAALAGDGLVEIWDLETQTRVQAWPHLNAAVLTWSWDGSRLAVSGHDADVTIFDAEHGPEPFASLTGHKASVWATSFHPSGERLASASEDGEVLIWNVTDAGSVGDEAVALGSPIGLFFLGPEDRLIAGTDGPGAASLDLPTGDVVILPINFSFDIIPNDRFTTVAGVYGTESTVTGRLVDARSGEIKRDFGECLIPKAISFDDGLVALDSMIEDCTSAPSQVRDLENDEVIIDLGKRVVFKAVFSPEGFDGPPFVAVNIASFGIEIYSLADHELVASFSIEDLGVTGFLVLSLDPEGNYLGVGTNGPNSIVIDMMSIMSGAPKMDAVLFNVEGHKVNAPQMRVTSDGIGASASYDPVYRVWDVLAGEMLFEIRVEGLDDLGAVNFTHDGTELAYEDANGVIRFTPLDTREVVARARDTVTRTLTDDECSQYLHTDGCVSE